MGVDSPGNTLDTAKSFQINPNTQTYFSDRINSFEGSDYYKFTLQNRSSVSLDLDELGADADLDLIRDLNGNLEVDSGEVINYSCRGGTTAESINTTLDAGTYFIRVYPYGDITTDYRLTVSPTSLSTPIPTSAPIPPIDNAGNTRNTARNIGMTVANSTYTDWVGETDKNDYYRFNLTKSSNFQLQLTNLSADADVQLLNNKGSVIQASENYNTLDEVITRSLDAGTYFIRVNAYSGSTSYKLNVSASSNTDTTQPTPTSVDTPTTPTPVITPTTVTNPTNYVGTLRADTFTFASNFSGTAIVSGNGNVDFGGGARDTLVLTGINFAQANFNRADSPNGGEFYNPGNGTRIFDAITVNNIKILFEGIETIKFADQTINLSVTPNDPLFNQQWNLQMMGVHNAWRFTTGSEKVLIGIEDTGLGTDANGNIHPDLRSTIYSADNYRDESTSFSHGTLNQGAIAATANNGIGTAGINWNSPVYSIDVVGGDTGDRDLAQATQELITRANSQGQRLVVNLSLAGGWSAAFEQLIKNNQNNALFVIAAGNGNTNTISSPANLASNYGNVIAVGASWGTTDSYGNARTPGDRISYENWWGSNYGNGLTIMAPSEYVAPSETRANSSTAYESGYNNRFNGTSAATPNISGVASLIWSVNSALTATQIKQILSQTAYDLGADGYDTTYGYGFVNADAAVRRAIAIGKGLA
jgi:serine protease